MNKLNKYLFGVTLITIGILYSCDHEIENNLDANINISQENAFLLGLNYLDLNINDLYDFAMTKKEAEDLNISIQDYNLMINDVLNANKFIEEQKLKKS